jgi:hypothetical protein
MQVCIIITIIIIIDFSLQKHNSQLASPMKTRSYIVPEGHDKKFVSEEIVLNLGISKISFCTFEQILH